MLATVLCGLGYALAQQGLRQGADDPQIQIAEDLAARLWAGADVPAALPGAPGVDVAHSLAPFVIVYDAQGGVVASTASLGGGVPPLPGGVLAAARHGEDRLTWQPAPGVRIAAVVVAYGGARPGFVLAGRSLREVERREAAAEGVAGTAWVVALAGTLAAAGVGAWIERRTEG